MATLKAPNAEQYLRASLEGYTVEQEVSYLDGAASGDVIHLGKIPQGCAIFSGLLTTNAANAGATISVGWAYVDGSSANAAEFVAAGTSIATAGAVQFNNGAAARTVMAKDAYLTLTLAGAAMSAATDLFVRPAVTNLGTE